MKLEFRIQDDKWIVIHVEAEGEGRPKKAIGDSIEPWREA